MEFDFLGVIALIAFVITLGTSAALIYLYAYTFKSVATTNTSILEIKSKIGSMIKDINTVNRQEFSVDTSQQQSINTITSRLDAR